MVTLVETALTFRKRASLLGRLADAEPDLNKACDLMREALTWIQLAENEEVLAFQPRASDLKYSRAN